MFISQNSFRNERDHMCSIFGAYWFGIYSTVMSCLDILQSLQTHEDTPKGNSLFLDLTKSPLKVTSFREI